MGVSVNGAPSSDRIQAAQQSRGPERALFGKLAQIASEAKARRVTKSSLIRESLEKALRPQSRVGAPSCYDLARDLAGAVKGLPEDLAQNSKYMEGFGQ
jgi:hypothetical protein